MVLCLSYYVYLLHVNAKTEEWQVYPNLKENYVQANKMGHQFLTCSDVHCRAY